METRGNTPRSIPTNHSHKRGGLKPTNKGDAEEEEAEEAEEEEEEEEEAEEEEEESYNADL